MTTGWATSAPCSPKRPAWGVWPTCGDRNFPVARPHPDCPEIGTEGRWRRYGRQCRICVAAARHDFLDRIWAEVRRPECPGGAPAPGLPGDRDGRTLAAVWAAMPYLRGRRKTRFFETWRSQPWNT